jgi:hypothetical protein
VQIPVGKGASRGAFGLVATLPHSAAHATTFTFGRTTADLFVAKDLDGSIRELAVGDDEDFGALLASIVPFKATGSVEASGGAGFAGFDPGDAWSLA